MTRLLRSVFELLIPDQKGQRAIEETLGDWRHAQSSAPTPSMRLKADAQGLVSLFRVVAISATGQVVDRNVWRPFAWTVVVSAGVGTTMVVPLLLSIPMGASSGELSVMATMLLPSAFVIVFALAGAVGFGTRRNQAAPIAGQIMAATVLLVVLLGWIVPAANQQYRLRAFAVLSSDTSPGEKLVRPLMPGPAELSLPKVVAAWRSDRSHEAAAAGRRLSITAALAIAGPTFLVLGVAVRRRWIPRGSWRLAQATSGAVAIAATIIGMLLARWLPDALPPAFIPFERLNAQLWLILAIAWLITVLALRTKHEPLST